MSRKQEIQDWYYNKFLPIYPNETRVDGGEKVLLRFYPDDETLEKIYGWVISYNRYRKWALENNRFSAQLPNLFTFFSDSRWKDKIPSRTTQEDPETNTQLLACHSCGKVEEGNGTIFQNESQVFCNNCYPDTKGFKKIGYMNMVKFGYGRDNFNSKKDWITACKEWCLSHGYKGEGPGPLETYSELAEAWHKGKA